MHQNDIPSRRAESELGVPTQLHHSGLSHGVNESRPAQIVLFGSRARGDASPDSDVDLLIVQDDEFAPDQLRHETLRRLRERLSGFGVAKDFTVRLMSKNGAAALTMWSDGH